ncbi:MAG: hypothetical protein IME96_04475 [Proteobacteria bacterium]|nr:hypothetical protein [Pseudomonadota bacterium]
MTSNIIDKLKDEGREAFLKLDPVDRILKMERLLNEIISIKAVDEGVTERDIYNRYLGRDKKRRHGL